MHSGSHIRPARLGRTAGVVLWSPYMSRCGRSLGAVFRQIPQCLMKHDRAIRYRAFSLPGQFAPRSESANRTLADSLPGQIAPWCFRSLALSFPGHFMPWNFHSLELLLCGSFALDIGGGRCVEMRGQSHEVWGTAEVPKPPRSSAIGSRRQSWRSRR